MAKRLTAVLLALVLAMGCVVSAQAAKSLRKGSKGSEVKTLQTKLQELGYYKGKIDGKFGSGTASAVKAQFVA